MQLSGTLVFSSGKADDFDIWSLCLDSGELSQLTHGDNSNDAPRWSPDGSKIAYVSNKTGAFEVWLMNADGSQQTQLTRAGRYHSGPSWSPDGTSLICSANYANPNEMEIWRIFVSGSKEPELLVNTPGMETEPSFSPDGKKVLFSGQRSGNYDIWEYEIGSKQFFQLTNHPGKDFAPAYSPDGSMIAFVSRETLDDDAEIWLMSSDGQGHQAPLTTNGVADQYVSWSPDGRHLVYCSSGKGPGTGRIQVLEVDSARIRKLNFDRSSLEKEIGAVVKDYGLFSTLTPDFLQRKFVDSNYFGSERHPHWKK